MFTLSEYVHRAILIAIAFFCFGFWGCLLVVQEVSYRTNEAGKTQKVVRCGFKHITGDSPVNEAGCGGTDCKNNTATDNAEVTCEP